MNLSTLDLTLFLGYLFLMMGFGIWISRPKKGDASTTKDYFLASGALPWWAVGGSLIASNISTEQILGMNGSGYVMGMAIASYELLAAITLIIVAKFFLPVFIHKGIYTMPQFLEKRFDNRVRMLMAFFWVLLFVFVNITSILYLGGLAIENIVGIPLIFGIMGLVFYSATFSIFGGLKAVVWTDVIQVIILVFGGLLAAYWVLDAVGGGFFSGLGVLMEKAPDKFNMILETDHPSYSDLPGIGVLLGGMWIANIYYWGNNQYIIQRALAAKSIKEAQKGVAFAAFLKILMPIIVVVPGIAAYVILQDPAAYGFTGAGIDKPDQAFPWVLNNFVGIGFKGLVFAALVAAIGSSISSMVNSVSTIFSLDIYQPLAKPNMSQQEINNDTSLVGVGKIAAGVALLAGALIAPALGSLDQVLQYIQEWTGFISPGVVAVFIFGMFWKRANANSAFLAVIGGFLINMAFKFGMPDLPFLDRMAFTFLSSSAIIVLVSLLSSQDKSDKSKNDMAFRVGLILCLCIISLPAAFFIFFQGVAPTWFGILILVLSVGVFTALLLENKRDDDKSIQVDTSLFRTDMFFNLSALAVIVILAAIYTILW